MRKEGGGAGEERRNNKRRSNKGGKKAMWTGRRNVSSKLKWAARKGRRGSRALFVMRLKSAVVTFHSVAGCLGLGAAGTAATAPPSTLLCVVLVCCAVLCWSVTKGAQMQNAKMQKCGGVVGRARPCHGAGERGV